MATTRSVQSLSLGSDAKGKDAFLLTANSYVVRLELAANTRKDWSVPAGVKRAIFQYEAAVPVYVRGLLAGDDNLTMPSGDVTNGTAPFMNPVGLIIEGAQQVQFICAAAAVVHIVAAG